MQNDKTLSITKVLIAQNLTVKLLKLLKLILKIDRIIIYQMWKKSTYLKEGTPLNIRTKKAKAPLHRWNLSVDPWIVSVHVLTAVVVLTSPCFQPLTIHALQCKKWNHSLGNNAAFPLKYGKCASWIGWNESEWTLTSVSAPAVGSLSALYSCSNMVM